MVKLNCGQLAILLLALISSSCGDNGEKLLVVCKGNLLNQASAVNLYANDHNGKLPSTLDALVKLRCIASLPTCPTGGHYTYEHSSSNFSILCTGSHEKVAPEIAANFYNHYGSKAGLTFQRQP